MTIDFKSFNEAYKKYLAAHPKVAAAIVVAESAAVGAVIDLFSNGMDYSKNGLKHAAAIVAGTVFTALRHYFKSNATNLRLQLEQKAKEAETK